MYMHIDIIAISMIPNTVCQVKLTSLPSRLLPSSLSCPICRLDCEIDSQESEDEVCIWKFNEIYTPKNQHVPKTGQFNRKCIFQPLIFREDVSFFGDKKLGSVCFC